VGFLGTYYNPETLDLMSKVLRAATRDRASDELANERLRTAMAFAIMTAISAGERDPERLRLAALAAPTEAPTANPTLVPTT
jgi:hypothetical protein